MNYDLIDHRIAYFYELRPSCKHKRERKRETSLRALWRKCQKHRVPREPWVTTGRRELSGGPWVANDPLLIPISPTKVG